MQTLQKVVLGCVFAASCILDTQAADVPPARKVAMAVPAYSWAGFYTGVNAGYGWAKTKVTIAGTSSDTTLKGAIAGGQVGFNVQNGTTVWGVELDGQWSGQRDKDVTAIGGLTFTETDTIPWFATLRGRLGWAADRTLLYVTGGGGYAGVKVDFAVSGLGSQSWSDSRPAWVVGAGAETFLTGNWTGKIEYLYADTGSFSARPFGVPTALRVQDNIVRVGLNYHY